MLAKTPGNLAKVWDEMVKTAEERMNRRVEMQSPLDAEVTETSTADWYLVQTFPNEEVRATRWLARRRFGVFRPMQQRKGKRNGDEGKPLQGWEQVFPGWLFVFCFDMGKMHDRLVACPGVMHVVCRVDDDFVQRVRALSWVYDDNAASRTHASTEAHRNTSRAKRVEKRNRKAIKKLKKALKRQGKWDSSTWANANELAAPERIALLQQALNAPPSGAMSL